MKEQGNKLGRPKAEVIRDSRLQVNVTEADAAFLRELAKDCGFKGVSGFVAHLLESLIGGGFSAASAVKLVWQLRSMLSRAGNQSDSFRLGDLLTAVRPAPAPPAQSLEEPSKRAVKGLLSEARQTLL